jgi:predicted double-glycine peptidase
LRFSFIAEQGYDSSCGLTVLASLLDRYWGRRTNELNLVGEFFADRLAKDDLTISLADMARVLLAKGFACKAYEMSYEQLEKAVGKYPPIIVHFDRTGGHFALILATRGGELLLADPAEGTSWKERRRFESEWSGKALAAVFPGGAVDSVLLANAFSQAHGRGDLLDRAALAWMGGSSW